MFSSMLSLLGSLRRGNFVTNSLRFRSSASAYLSRTPSVAGNRKTWTWSGWIKRSKLGALQGLFSRLTAAGNDTNSLEINFQATDTLVVTGYATQWRQTSAVFRDVSSWYHIVVAVDTTQPDATANNRIRIYVNGSEITLFSTLSNPTQNADLGVNSTLQHSIGSEQPYASGREFDGYITEVNFIDGQALTPSSFGQIESTTGVWSPKQYVGSYGTNGFYLKFADASAATAAAIGKDSSGNGNNWTPSGISVTAGVTYDSMIDVPVSYADGGNGRGNYAVLNPLVSGGGTISQGNLNYVGGAVNSYAHSNFALSSGKWYCEMTVINVGTTIGIGIYNINSIGVLNGIKSRGYISNGNKYIDGNQLAYANSFTTNDVIGVAINVDSGTIEFYKNNVSQGIAFSDIGSDTWFVTVQGGNSPSAALNFGQRPFQNTTAWATLQAAGFRALNTNNLPTPAIVNGANFMAATTYTGNVAARSLSNAVNSVSFQPDLVWIKSRTPGATNHALFDSTRGITKYLSSNTTTGETPLAQGLTAFNADGFSLGADTTLVNANANSYIAWQWKAGGAAVSNTQGTITSQVSANTTAGVSVVTYTGTGVNATVGHGLGVAPKMVIVKSRSSGVDGWPIYHDSIGAANWLALNLTNQSLPSSTFWNNTTPTSNVFSIGNNSGVNTSSATYVAYCFAEIAGFSRFGSYTGNGSADGPFVFCGFRPRFVMIKRTDVADDWELRDVSRDTYNTQISRLRANLPAAEVTTVGDFDYLSNGFKLRNTNSAYNISGGTYIFAAFAEVPSKYALAR